MSEHTFLERYKIYRLRAGELQEIASTDTPGGVGQAIITLAGEDEFAGCCLGILDTCPGGVPAVTGKWLVNPFTR